MPNRCVNDLLLHGARDLLDATERLAPDGTLNFSLVRPEPDDLIGPGHGTFDVDADALIHYYLTGVLDRVARARLAAHLSTPWLSAYGCASLDEARAHLEVTFAAQYPGESLGALARHRDRCRLEHGAPDVTVWRQQAWGTHSAALDGECRRVSAGTLRLRFDTAWCPPRGIVQALAALGLRPDLCYWLDGFEGAGRIWTDEDGREHHHTFRSLAVQELDGAPPALQDIAARCLDPLSA